MQEIELKPCPFCGGEVQVYDDECGHYAIGCKFCCDVAPITTWEDTIEKAIAIWNTRNPKGEHGMQEIFEKIRERLEREVEYQSSKADAAGKTCAFEEITVVKAREKMAECYEHAIEIVNQVAEGFGGDINVGSKDDCCEWVMCDEDENVYNTACGNSEMLFDGSPIDNNYSFCPYCGKKIKLLECTNCKWYWQNNDTENWCSGSATTCIEYSEIAPYKPKGENNA